MYENKTQNYKNVYVAFEGGEGGGKSLQLDNLKQYLNLNGIKNHFTFEPGGGEKAKAIREILLHGKEELDAKEQFKLFCDARTATIKSEVEPYLKKGYDVFTDRSFVSSMVYQGYALGHGIEHVFEKSMEAIKGFLPDRILYFDIEPTIGLERARNVTKSQNKKKDRWEDEDMEFHYKVREGYLKAKEIIDEKVGKDVFKVINANRGIEEIFEDVKKDYALVSDLKRLDDGNMIRACEFLKGQRLEFLYGSR